MPNVHDATWQENLRLIYKKELKFWDLTVESILGTAIGSGERGC
jgi:hypothetical protein